MSKQLTIGLFGFGVVGKGLYDVLHATATFQSSIKKICIKNADKKRSIDAHHFTTDANELLNDDNINVIVELIDDADAAYEIVTTALKKGKAVVSANKKMIATHFDALLKLQAETNTPFLYEASSCGSIPIIRNLEEYYDNDLLKSFRGIVNGSTNFILTKILQEDVSFEKALLTAQQLGFAESNPALDTQGYDAANKLVILLAHAFGTITSINDIIFTGIESITLQDAQLAKEKNYQIKLVANAQKLKNGKLATFILPQFVEANDDLYHVPNEFNAVVTESSFTDKHFFKGKGAGAFPTASAVLSDISALRYDYRYEYKKIHHVTDTRITHDFYLKVFVGASSFDEIQQSEFEHIEEWHNGQSYCWLTGIIHAQKLYQNKWWQAKGISLIAFPDAIAENVEYK
ncbi:MAG: homoserine dehydrogenase, partial [Ferruginibacter sp.]